MIKLLCCLLFLGEVAIAGEVPGGPAAAVHTAWGLMSEGHWSDAEALLAGIRSNGNENDECQVRFAQGNLWQYRKPDGDPVRAASNYEWIIAHHRENGLAPWAQLALARLPELDVIDPKPERAIPIYQQVIDTYPQSDAAQEAAIGLALAEWAVQGNQAAGTIVTDLRRWTAGHPGEKYAAQFYMTLARLECYPLQDYSAAAKDYAAVLQCRMNDDNERRLACWTLANLAENKLGDHAVAIRYYTEFIMDYPSSTSVFMAKQALKRMGAPIPGTQAEMSLESKNP